MTNVIQRIRQTGLGALAVALLLMACQSDSAAPTQETLERDVFIDTYVELRMHSLNAPNQLISNEDRDRILAQRGITADDLIEFAEIHGADVVFMREVWNEVEERLEDLRTRPDTGVNRS